MLGRSRLPHSGRHWWQMHRATLLWCLSLLLLAGCQSSASRLPPQFVYQSDNSRSLARMLKDRAPSHEPGAKFGYHHLIRTGTIIEILTRRDGWVQIVTPDEARPGASLYYAWLPEEFLEVVPGPRGSWPQIAIGGTGSQIPPRPASGSTPRALPRAAPVGGNMVIERVAFDCRRDSITMFGREGYSHCEVNFNVTSQLPYEGAWSGIVSCNIELESHTSGDYIPRTISDYSTSSYFGNSGLVTTFHNARISVLPAYGDGPNRVRLSDIRCSSSSRRSF
jgi:hypothetical protein